MIRLNIKQVESLLREMEEGDIPLLDISTSETGIIEARHKLLGKHWVVANNGRMINISPRCMADATNR